MRRPARYRPVRRRANAARPTPAPAAAAGAQPRTSPWTVPRGCRGVWSRPQPRGVPSPPSGLSPRVRVPSAVVPPGLRVYEQAFAEARQVGRVGRRERQIRQFGTPAGDRTPDGDQDRGRGRVDRRGRGPPRPTPAGRRGHVPEAAAEPSRPAQQPWGGRGEPIRDCSGPCGGRPARLACRSVGRRRVRLRRSSPSGVARPRGRQHRRCQLRL